MITSQQQYGRVGNRVTSTRDLDALPDGSTIADTSNTYRKIGGVIWERVVGGTRYNSSQFNGGSYTVASIPDWFEQCDPPRPTVEQYMWNFRDEALRFANQHGVSYSASVDTLNQMGTNTVPIGPGVTYRDMTSLNTLPQGTVVYCGHPEQPDTYGVWMRHGTGWKQVLGNLGTMTEIVTVATYEGSMEPVPWVVREATDEDRDAIRQFRAKAWQMGWNLKRSQGWCSTYESVMRQMGLTSAAVREARSDVVQIGERFSPSEAVICPVGTVFRWQSNTNAAEWALYLRVNGMENDNMAGTRKIAGTTESARNYRSSMQAVALHPDNPGARNEGMAVIPFSAEVIDAFPSGTLFNTAPGGPGYVVARDGLAQSYPHSAEVPANGRWRGRDFGTQEFIYYYGWDGQVR